jgi:hypothetical protein
MRKTEVRKSKESSYNLKQMLLLIWTKFLSGTSISKCPNSLYYMTLSVLRIDYCSYGNSVGTYSR